MDFDKLKVFLRNTQGDKDYRASQEKYDMELKKMEGQLRQQKAVVSSMLKSKGWEYVENWLNSDKDALKNRLYKEVKDRNFKKAEKTTADIEAINKLFAALINLVSG